MEVPLPLLVPMLELEPGGRVGAAGGGGGAVPDMLPLEEELVAPLGNGEGVVDGVVLELVDEEVGGSVEDLAASSFLLQADRDRAAIRARAAHCAIGDLIIRNSLGFVSKCIEWD